MKRLIFLTFAFLTLNASANETNQTLGLKEILCGGSVGKDEGMSIDIAPADKTSFPLSYHAQITHDRVTHGSGGTVYERLRELNTPLREVEYVHDEKNELIKIRFVANGVNIRIQYSTRPGLMGLGGHKAQVRFKDGTVLKNLNSECYVSDLE